MLSVCLSVCLSTGMHFFFIEKWATPTFWRVYSEFNFKNNVNVQKIFGCLFAEIYVVKVFSYNKRLAVNSDSCLIFFKLLLHFCCSSLNSEQNISQRDASTFNKKYHFLPKTPKFIELVKKSKFIKLGKNHSKNYSFFRIMFSIVELIKSKILKVKIGKISLKKELLK